MIALYINDKLADLESKASVSLSKSFEKNGNSDFSYSFEMPPTPTNQKIFAYLNKLESANKQFLNYPARLEIDGLFAFDGFVRVDSASEEGYSVNLVGGQSNKIEDFFGDDEKLTSIKLDDDRYKIIFPDPTKQTTPFIIPDYSSSYSLNSQDKAWCYPFALYSHPLNIRNNNFFLLHRNEQATTNADIDADILPISQAEQVLMPFFNVGEVIRSIFKSKGYEVDGNFFSEQSVYKQLYEAFSGTYENYLERHNQRFSARMEYKSNVTPSPNVGIAFAIPSVGGIARFNPLTLTSGNEAGALHYQWINAFSKPSYEGRHAKLSTKEWYTPRDKNKTERVIKTNDDGSYKFKVLKSGWYHVNMRGNIFTRDTSNSGRESLSFDRNIYEINLVKNGARRYYSGIFTTDSTCIGAGYLPTIEEKRIYTDSGDVKFHFIDIDHRAMPFSLNDTINGGEVSATFLRTKAEVQSNVEEMRFMGERDYLKQFTLPKNGGTLFVDNEDFVCGVRVGNWHYNQDDGEQANKNRSPHCSRFNLPILPTAENVGPDKAIPYGVSGQGVKQNAYKYDATFTKDMDIAYKMEKIRNNQGQLVSTNFESDTYLGDTMLNMCSSKGYSFASVNQPQSIVNAVTTFDDLANDPLRITSEDVDFGKSYFYSDLEQRMSVERLNYDDLYWRTDKFNFDTNNLVWLEKDDEIECIMNLPCYYDEARGIEDEEEGYVSSPIAINIAVQLDYIGTSNKDWMPTQTDMWTSDRWSYMHQYLQDVAVSEWLKQIVNLLNLNISIDKIKKVASVNYSLTSSNSGSEDITNYVDFDSITFEPNGEAKSIKNGYAENEGIALTPTKIDDTYNTGNDGDATEQQSKYEYPASEMIEIDGELFEAPVICKDDVWKLEYPNLDIFDMSGTGKPRLYFATGREVSNFDNAILGGVSFVDYGKTTPSTTNFNFARRWKEMSSKNGDIDLQKPRTLVEQMWRMHNNKEQMMCKVYLPIDVYNRIKRDTIIFVDGMAFDCVKIDNYNVNGDQSCTMTLIKRN